MNRSPDDDRLPADPWLREALRHAPGADVPVPAAVRSAILDQARRAAEPVKAQRHRSWRDALLRMLTPTRMGWAGAVTAGVLVLVVVGLQRETAPLEPKLAELSARVPAKAPAAAGDVAVVVASRQGGETARNPASPSVSEGTTLALATVPPNAKISADAGAPAPVAPRADSLPAPTRARPTAADTQVFRRQEAMSPQSAMAPDASVAAGRPDASPLVASATHAPEAGPSAPLSVAAAAAAPMPSAAGAQVVAQASAAPPATAAEAASDGARLAARASMFASTSPRAAAAGSQPQSASALGEAGSPRPAAAGLVHARTVSADRLGEILQWTLGREGLRWAAAGAEGPWGPAQEAWLRALRAAASGRWGESPALAGVAGAVVLQAPGEPAVRVTVGDAPWAVWVQVEGGTPQAARLDSRARARIETLRQGW